MKLAGILETAGQDDPFQELPARTFADMGEQIAYLKNLEVTYFNLHAKAVKVFTAQPDATGPEDTFSPETKKIRDRVSKLWRKFQAVKKQVAQLKNQRETQAITAVRSSKSHKEPIIRMKIGDIPLKLPRMIGLPVSFENPYFYGKKDQYAGTVNGFPFSDKLLVQYAMLSETLEKAGLPGFTQAYGSIYVKHGTSSHANFAIYGVDGKLLWRRYDPGTGVSNNRLYVKGNKIDEVINIINMPDAERVLMFSTWFPEYFK